MTSVAEQLVAQLEMAGVRHIYGIVGDSLNPVVDAVRRSKQISWIQTRHEEVAAFAAAAEAEITGRLAVCAGSCGPGNLHLINGLYDANRTRVPVLAIASHIPTPQIGTLFFQETHPDRLFNECSVYSEMISSPAQMPRISRTAIQHALAGPGVAVITLPGDVAKAAADDSQPLTITSPHPARIVPADEDVRALAAAINEAEKVTFFVGHGAMGAHDEVLDIAKLANAPIGHSLRGKEAIQWDNPHDVGMSGLLGYGACQTAMEKADLLVLVGTDFPYNQFLPAKVRTAQIELDAAHLGRRTRLDLAIHGGVRETMTALRGLVQQKENSKFLDDMVSEHRSLMDKVVGAYTDTPAADATGPIHPEYAAAVIDRHAGEDAIFTVDTGMCNVWAARYLHLGPNRRMIGSFLHGSMANAMPHAIGAALADAERARPVIALCGDGGLSMLLGDLLTVKAYELPVKIIVMNNSTLGMVKLEMLVEGLPDYATDHASVDYAQIAAGMGLRSVRVEKPGDLDAVIASELSRPGPALIDIVTDPNALSLPPKVTPEQMKGFATAMAKEVLSGSASDVMSMARSNLRNIPRKFGMN
ncbi:pyruvate dehydrogenase [Nanchangia anserum]|uniref:Pyruvate dehydrogenase n=1 Tax=Nanchangia anserum TaxID=2692125 RepID=A0A8I0GBW0_9ACTO|nr:pyruvate dehydrogenase [Nanchangia anserum]MBD3689431.1 pyruvate dehydrogenase [Nanchangia anserum]QOX81635.1 pyruvate dehydrogenase [Nanchangia anserum]